MYLWSTGRLILCLGGIAFIRLGIGLGFRVLLRLFFIQIFVRGLRGHRTGLGG